MVQLSDQSNKYYLFFSFQLGPLSIDGHLMSSTLNKRSERMFALEFFHIASWLIKALNSSSSMRRSNIYSLLLLPCRLQGDQGRLTSKLLFNMPLHVQSSDKPNLRLQDSSIVEYMLQVSNTEYL